MIVALRNFFRILRSYTKLLAFLIKIFFLVVKSHEDARMRLRLISLLSRMMSVLSTPQQTVIKTTLDSRVLYQEYDDREIKEYFEGEKFFLVNNQVKWLRSFDVRQQYLKYVFENVDELLEKKNHLTILEVGCGNGINLMEISKRYGDRVTLHGVDISENRLSIGRKYFNKELAKTSLSVQSITEKTNFEDNNFDLVYSIHCLEQIAYDLRPALTEMHRITADRLLMLEPVFENGSFVQKCYLLLSDHTRILLKTIHELKFNLVRNQILLTQSNLENQSSLLLILKGQR